MFSIKTLCYGVVVSVRKCSSLMIFIHFIFIMLVFYNITVEIKGQVRTPSRAIKAYGKRNILNRFDPMRLLCYLAVKTRLYMLFLFLCMQAYNNISHLFDNATGNSTVNSQKTPL